MINKDILEYGKTAQGRSELIDFNNDLELTRKQAILAKCFECNLGYVDGKEDCKSKHCPLYGYMPYNKNKYDLGKNLSQEKRDELRKRLDKARKSITRS